MKQQVRVLIVDDDEDIRGLLRILLESHDYQVREAVSGAAAVHLLQADPACDLVILDIMMPEMDGVTACREIRKFSRVPILFLTAKGQLEDKVLAYRDGGDDYVVKPFSPPELLVKVESLVRRYRNYGGKQEEIQELSFRLDAGRRCVILGGEKIDLTGKEFEIIQYMYLNRGRTISVQEIYEAVWQEISMPNTNNAIMVHILNLRKKLEQNPDSPRLIRTVWGKGYQFG